MSILIMAVYSTETNKKDECLDKTLQSLKDTVDFTKHRLVLSVNGHTEKTRELFSWYQEIISELIFNESNLGTAEAVNKGFKMRNHGEHAIKLDDDVVIYQNGWADLMQEICDVNPYIGQVGLKRPDLIESPDHENEFYRSELFTQRLAHREITLEKCHHIMGTCVMHSDNLLNCIGYMWQPKIYGFDDSFMSLRSELAGFKNVFIPEIKIEHIDEGKTEFQKWKQDHAASCWDEYHKSLAEFKSGERDIYYNPFI
jgi:GT2 family glycosyltransferase